MQYWLQAKFGPGTLNPFDVSNQVKSCQVGVNFSFSAQPRAHAHAHAHSHPCQGIETIGMIRNASPLQCKFWDLVLKPRQRGTFSPSSGTRRSGSMSNNAGYFCPLCRHNCNLKQTTLQLKLGGQEVSSNPDWEIWGCSQK